MPLELFPDKPATPDLGPPGRAWDDVPATRKAIYDQTLSAAQSLPALSNKKHTLRLTNVVLEPPEHYSLKEQKHALLHEKSLGRKLRGTWELLDNQTGQVLDSQHKTVATVPWLTPRGTFIHQGTEYSVGAQMRLKPGVYTRQTEAGELQTHVNILPGQGVTHRYSLDPASGIFKLHVRQSTIPLVSLLKSLGVNDRQLHEAWGSDLAVKNLLQDKPQNLAKLYKYLGPRGVVPENSTEMEHKLREAWNKMPLDPEVSHRTLGQRYDKLSPDVLLATTKKILAVARGEADTDDRDHLANQQFLGPEDLFSERLSKDYGGMRRRLLQRASQRGDLSSLPAGALSPQLQAVMLTSGLGSSLEEINTSELLDKQSRVTRMGEGGLPSTDSVPDSARAVQPSHYGFLDPKRTVESEKTGVDVYFSHGVRKGPDRQVYQQFRNPQNGSLSWKTPQDIAHATVSFPGVLQRWQTPLVPALKNGQFEYVPRGEVQWELPHYGNIASSLANLVPGKANMKAHRVSMASRMLTQALPLVQAEAPWVRSGVPGEPGQSYEEKYGPAMGALRASQDGVVEHVEPDGIHVRYADGTKQRHELYHLFPFARKTSVQQLPRVQPGQPFRKGDLLAGSNYVDHKGATALGTNARVGYYATGKNFEDAVSISQAFAEKLKSQHMYLHELQQSDKSRPGKSAYISLFPRRFPRVALDALDEDGVVKPGTLVQHGHPLIVGAQEKEHTGNRVHKKGSKSFSDQSVLWDHTSPGRVMEVIKRDQGPLVMVQAEETMNVGDKLSGRHGNKGVVAEIIPNEHMPRGEDGNPLEILLDPAGMISRGNPSQYNEAALGKIAAKTGEPYRLPDYESADDMAKFVEGELQRHGVKDEETIHDPLHNRNVPGVMVGNAFFMKLHHSAEPKEQGRGIRGSYSAFGEPAKGGATGSKKLGLLSLNALISHRVPEVIRDASLVRGQRNESYWLDFLQGHTPRPLQVPDRYKHFISLMQGSGINVIPTGNQLQVMALRNQDVSQLAGDRELKSGELIDWNRGQKPIPGGLFDPELFGEDGDRWAKITLSEPMLNPVMEEPARRLLHLTQQGFHDVLAGKKDLPGGGKGPEGIAAALGKINLDKELIDARAQSHSGSRTARDDANRRLRILKDAHRLKLHPGDWILNQAPVLPPKFRPVAELPDKKIPMVADANYLYRELLSANENLQQLKGQVDPSALGAEHLALYQAFKAVTGLAEPSHPKLQEKGVRGLLREIFGSSPKHSFMQSRLLSASTDVVGRAVIAPDPDLDMDEVALPEKRAWEVYRPFVARALRRRGMPLVQALKQVEERTPLARKALLAELEQRPVIVDRAPVWHKFGVMAFRPKLTAGSTMRVSPLICKGFTADFDGDQMQYHVPVTDESVKEAYERMLPSRSLLSPADYKTPVHQPQQQFLAGLYHASTAKSKRRAATYINQAAALAAYHRGEQGLTDEVRVP